MTQRSRVRGLFTKKSTFLSEVSKAVGVVNLVPPVGLVNLAIKFAKLRNEKLEDESCTSVRNWGQLQTHTIQQGKPVRDTGEQRDEKDG